MADLEVWKDYVTVINAARLNAIRDHIMTNEGNISYQQTLINANTTSIYTNTNNIANLSNIKLSRDGSQVMTGELICNAGLKTGVITSANGSVQIQADLIPSTDGTLSIGSTDKPWNTITALHGNFSSITPMNLVLPILGWLSVKWGRIWSGGEGCDGLLLYSDDFRYTAGSFIGLWSKIPNQGSIEFATIDETGDNTKTRMWIWGGYDDSWVEIFDAQLIPHEDDSLWLGQKERRWKEVHAVRACFSELNASITNVPRSLPFYLENPSSSDKYLLGAGTVSTMYQFNTTVTLTGYKLMMLTSASNGYIKVTIDDAKGWNYEKTYSLGSAGGYRYNESFTHIIETDNGIQLKISNCSQISSTSIVLEYK